MMRVLAFGTYDILHEGHERFLQQARSLGDELFVVIALDETVKGVKGRLPHNTQKQRLARIQALPYVGFAALGNAEDKYKVIEELKPDIIALGYDQTAFVDGLIHELNGRGLNPKIVRIMQAHEPEKFKSSKLRQD